MKTAPGAECVIDTVRSFDSTDWIYEAACLREPHEGCVGDRVICRIPRDERGTAPNPARE